MSSPSGKWVVVTEADVAAEKRVENFRRFQSSLRSHDLDVDPYPGTKSEDWGRYQEQIRESDGFDVDEFPGIEKTSSTIAPVDCGQHHVEHLLSAIDEQNQRRRHGGSDPISLVRVIKLNSQDFPPRLFFTFVAKDVGDGTESIYQAQLSMLFRKIDAVIFRQKPPDVQEWDELGWLKGGPLPRPNILPESLQPCCNQREIVEAQLRIDGIGVEEDQQLLRETPSAPHQP